MSATRIIILGIGFVAAGLAAFLALNLTPTQQQAAPQVVTVPSIETTDILVATKQLNRGERVDGGDLAWRKWPTSSVTDVHIKRDARPRAIEDLTNASARFIIAEGEPVQDAKLVMPGEGFMAAVLPKGTRAVSTSVSPTTGAGGFILPDDRVDVLMTHQLGSSDGQPVYVTEPVLRNVRVLAIDQVIQEQDGQPVVVGKTATLQLTDTQVKALTVAEQIATQITLALRSLRDSSEDEADETNLLSGAGGSTVTVVRYGRSSVVRTNK